MKSKTRLRIVLLIVDCTGDTEYLAVFVYIRGRGKGLGVGLLIERKAVATSRRE